MRIQYKTFTIRIDEKTRRLFKQKKEESGLSWNLFIYRLLNKKFGGSQGNRVYDPSGISVTLASQAGGLGAKTGLYAIKNNNKNYGKLDDRALESKEGLQKSEGSLLDMQQEKENRDTSYRRELAQQQSEESSGDLPELPHKDTQGEALQDLQSSSQGSGILRETLSEVQEIRRSVENENKSIHSNLRIRRLTPLEAERLMGLPDNWTKYGVEEMKHSKDKYTLEDFKQLGTSDINLNLPSQKVVQISDSQRYKMCGNGVVTNCVKEIIKRILCSNP